MSDGPGRRLVAVPDTDGELQQTLGVLEEVLLQLQPLTDEDEPAAPGLGGDELHALQRISMILYAAERATTADLYAPGGNFNYVPLRFISVLSEDLAAVGRAVARLDAAMLPGGDEYAREALGNFVQGRRAPQDLIVDLAQAHAMLDLAPDTDTRLLCDTLLDKTGPVVLTGEQEQAYTRFIDRVLAVRRNDPLDRFLHRGR